MKVGDLIEFLSVTRPHNLDGQWRLGLLLNIENMKEDKYCRVYYKGRIIRIRQAQVKQ